MIRTQNLARSLAVALAATLILAPRTPAQEAKSVGPLAFVVKAGPHSRTDTPIRFDVPASRFGAEILKAVEAGPVSIPVFWGDKTPEGKDPIAYSRAPVIAQAEKVEGSPNLCVTCIMKDIPAGAERRYFLFGIGKSSRDAGSFWHFTEPEPGALILKHEYRTVFQYNAAPVSHPNYKEIQNRDAYIHPAYSPSGALITGDFSTSHPHHRGFFLAYERTKTGDLTPDFWNIHVGTGKIYADGHDKPVVGPVTARLSTRHRWEAKDKAKGSSVVVLRERWDVEAYQVPGAAYWLFDITSTQQAVDRPLELLPYRYGGMAYRGPEPFVKGTLDVLTSEGKHRKDGDQKPARWVDLTGPVADGSNQYAGAMIADHPSNPHYPNVARIHPTTLPFFCYVPAHDKPLTIATDTPSVFRYRVLIHDGHPDPKLDERVARDFAEPPVVVVE
jgi:hypothetical protein